MKIYILAFLLIVVAVVMAAPVEKKYEDSIPQKHLNRYRRFTCQFSNYACDKRCQLMGRTGGRCTSVRQKDSICVCNKESLWEDAWKKLVG